MPLQHNARLLHSATPTASMYILQELRVGLRISEADRYRKVSH